MAKSDDNLRVINNFILHVTHANEGDHDAETPITLTANDLYRMANDYIAEDWVDGVPGDNDN